MIIRSTRIWLGSVALLLLGAGTTVAWSQSISTCPYIITSSGNYIVTKNLNSAGTCITIQADNVTIDLQGHTITGNGTGNGITDGGRSDQNIVIANGTVQSFGGAIIVNFSHPVTISGLTVQKNAGSQTIALFSATVF